MFDTYEFARTVITRCQRQGGLNDENVFCHNSGAEMSEIKV